MTRPKRMRCALFLSWLFGAGVACAIEVSPGDWPIYHGDAALRGVAPVTFPESLEVKWRTRLGAPPASPPVVCGDRVVVAVEGGGLLGLTRQGNLAWSVAMAKPANPATTVQESFSTPPLCIGGLVLIGSDQGFLYAVEAGSGARRWKQKTGDDLLGSPNWVSAGTGREVRVLVMSRGDGVLKLLSLADGHRVWAAAPVSRCDTPPAVGSGVAVFGACDAAVHILSLTDGTSRGVVRLDEHGPMAGGAAVEGDHAFVGTRDGSVVCVDIPRATVAWTSRCASNEVFTTPALTSNRVVAGASDGRIYCLDRRDGKPLWVATTEGNPSSPAIAGDKVVVASGGTLFLFSLETGRQVWAAKAGDSLTAPAITGDGVFVGTDDGFLVLYGPPGKAREKS
ncbi:MAG: PQQ-binding-like beta-propeller repeat protein [bacterium]